MINNFKEVVSQIDEEMIRMWVKDLIIVKTFIGLRFQEAVLKKIADTFDTESRLANPEEESRGIDGYVGNIPISLKPVTYQSKGMLPERIRAEIVYYEKQKDGLKVIIHDRLIKKIQKNSNRD